MQVRCPHCRTPCLVAEQHLGVPVKCGLCGRSFTTRAEASATPIRLEIAAAGAANHFLTQHLVYWNLDVKHELAVLVLVGGPDLGSAAAALTPLLNGVLSGSSQDTVAAAANVSAVIWDGRLSLGGRAGCAIYHHRGGRLTRLPRDPLKLAAGDWLILTGDGSPPPVEESTLPRAIATAPPSAAAVAAHLAQRGGTILVVRCY